MIKQELMETYAAEQLAGMVINLQSASEVKNDEIYKLKWQISSLEEENGRLQAKLDTYNNYLLTRATKEAKEMIDHNHFSGVRIVTWEQWSNREKQTMNISDIQKCQEEYEKLLKESPLESTINKISRDILEQKNNAMAMEFTRIICDLLKQNGVYVHCKETKLSEKITTNSIEEQYGIVFDSMDFSKHDKEFMEKIEELQSEVEKYRKAFEDAKKERDCRIAEYQNRTEKDKTELERAKNTINQIDDILEKLFGVRHDTVNKPYEFEKILSERVENGNVTDFLPVEPIKVADMLINAEGEYEHNPIAKELYKEDKGTYRIFDIGELRQIAEHLLVYCNNVATNLRPTCDN